jgi:spermidine synthase
MNFLKRNFLFLIVLITGAAVLIIEVTATRILAPYFGNTLFTISSIIGIVLGALSFGYYIGGILADKYPKFSVFFFLIFIAGIFSLLIQVFSKTVLPTLGYTLDMKIGPPLISLILFFIPILILGMISPLAIKLKTLELKEIGKVSGKVFFWSTLGSIIGSFLAGFFLIPHFGISKIIISTGVILIIIGFLGGRFFGNDKYKNYFNRPQLFFFMIIVLLFSLITFFLPKKASVIFRKDGLYSQITIEDIKINNKKVRALRLDRTFEGAVFLESNELLFEYTKYYVIYEIINPQAEKALFLGGGAYSNPRKLLLDQNNIKRVDVVEIEPMLYQLAKQYFKLQEDPRLFNYITDGRRFLKDTNQKYDMIFADVYYSIYSIPIHFTTKEFFSLANSRLSENGLFLMNIIGRLEGEGNLFLLSEIKTFKSIFKDSYLFAVDSPNKKGLQNFILFGLKNNSQKIDFGSRQVLENENEVIRNLPKKLVDLKDLGLDSAFILTDDFVPIEYLIAKLF